MLEGVAEDATSGRFSRRGCSVQDGIVRAHTEDCRTVLSLAAVCLPEEALKAASVTGMGKMQNS